MKTRLGLALMVASCFAASCSQSDTNRKETYPVTGRVLVDGQPAEMVQVTLHDDAGVDKAMPTFSTTFTGPDGKFSLSTYEEGDGAPPGDYTATFLWGKIDMLSMQYGGPDKLREKYTDPKTSQFKVKVEKGKPADMGAIELTTK